MALNNVVGTVLGKRSMWVDYSEKAYREIQDD